MPGKWKEGVNYAFDVDEDGARFGFSVGEEVVVRRRDASMRFARVEAQAGNEVVLVLGPDQRSNKKDAQDVLPFTLVTRENVGKIVNDDWADDCREEETTPLGNARWWKYAWGGGGSSNQSAAARASPVRPSTSAVAANSRLLWQRGRCF